MRAAGVSDFGQTVEETSRPFTWSRSCMFFLTLLYLLRHVMTLIGLAESGKIGPIWEAEKALHAVNFKFAALAIASGWTKQLKIDVKYRLCCNIRSISWNLRNLLLSPLSLTWLILTLSYGASSSEVIAPEKSAPRMSPRCGKWKVTTTTTTN